MIFMKCGQMVLEIFLDPKHPEHVTEPEDYGLRHIAFFSGEIR